MKLHMPLRSYCAATVRLVGPLVRPFLSPFVAAVRPRCRARRKSLLKLASTPS